MLMLSCHHKEIMVEEHECTARVLVADYNPIEFQDEKKLPKTLSKKLKKEFHDSLGRYLAEKIIFTTGFEYDLKEINEKYFEKVKNYQWEIPRFFLNYAIKDTISNITHCIRLEISNKGELLMRNIPRLLDKYQNQILLTEDNAIDKIRNKLDEKELKKIKFEFRNFEYNWKKKVFEWEFGRIEKVWIEAFEKGEIRQGKANGIIEL